VKQGKRPTAAQKATLKRLGFDPADWLVCKNDSEGMVIEYRYTGKHRTIPRSLL
jgi:hypothetical protein